MESLKLWARHGEAGRQASALGERVPMATAREECTEAGRLCAIDSGRLQTGAEACPAPRCEPDSGLEVLLPAHLAGRFAGLDARRNTG
jgi:hypothetical protein